MTATGRTRIITNPPALRITKQVGEVQYDPEQWQAIQQQMDKRGQNQRGILRAKDPARYPLACRLVDLTGGCGSILYGRTNQGRAVYACGRYMRTSGGECASNQVDAEAMLRFTLQTLGQLLDRNGNRDKLRQKLLARAQQSMEEPLADPKKAELGRLHHRRAELQEQKGTIEYRMARERDDELYAALTRQYQATNTELTAVEEAIRRLEADQQAAQVETPEAQAEAALALLDDVARITTDPAVRAEINPLAKRLGLWIGLSFQPAVKGKKRRVQRLVSGRMIFGDAPLPVPLFGNNNVDGGLRGCGSPAQITQTIESHHDQEAASSGESAGATAASATMNDEKSREKKQTAGTGAIPVPAIVLGDRAPDRLNKSQPEGISITKVSRGERI